MEVAPGTVVGDYEVGEHLGSGHWGSVYAGRPRRDAPAGVPSRVALKFLPAARGAVAARERAFSREARHPRLVRTYEVLTRPDGTVVLVMERARSSVRERLDARPGQPLPAAELILGQLWEALRHMHDRGWVHGDLKPANVLLADDGSVRVADFGVAAELEGTHAYTDAIGTQDYLPPEWWDQGLDSRGVLTRPATDIWAFGVIAHEVLTGGLHPFPGAAAQARAAAVREYAAHPGRLRLAPGISPEWQSIIQDCLTVPYPERMTATRDLTARLPHPAASPRRSRRSILTVGAVLMLLVLGGSAAAGSQRGGTPAAPAPAPGELRPDAAVPARFRAAITATAHRCGETAVTPALIAAMLYAESGFDPAKRSPQTDEYGIAMWTPSVFVGWAPKHPDRVASVFDPDDAITAMGALLCHLAHTVGYLPGDPRLLAAAGYRVGGKRVRAANGVPPEIAGYLAVVRQKLAEYGY
ncbi:protein kinase [Actinoplanes sp. NPDC049599]|uniref:protein kinase domain-containing protein n=1 Tax=Actinoplanes sp. NPDC049599 TaxID=3363903 RepID=UPI0037B39B74